MIFGKKETRLFVAGPVNAAKSLKKLMPFPEIGHREPEFTALYENVKNKLFKVLNASPDEFDIAIIGGSGTSAIESMISSVVNKKILVISNGAFGERAYKISSIYRLPRAYLRYNWGEYPDIKQIEKILKENPEIGFIYMVHMETSTGMLNPIKEVGNLCKKYNKTYLIDSVCAIAGEKLDMNEFNIDFCAFSSNKGIGGPPVMSAVCCRKSKLTNMKRRNMYMDLSAYLKYGKINQTPFTPAIPLFYLLNETLSDLLKEGIDNRKRRYKENCNLLKAELSMMGLKFYLINPGRMAHTMVNVIIPKGFTFGYIHDRLKRKGFIVYAGKDELRGKIIHIATMGSLTKKDIKSFVKNLKEVLRSITTV